MRGGSQANTKYLNGVAVTYLLLEHPLTLYILCCSINDCSLDEILVLKPRGYTLLHLNCRTLQTNNCSGSRSTCKECFLIRKQKIGPRGFCGRRQQVGRRGGPTWRGPDVTRSRHGSSFGRAPTHAGSPCRNLQIRENPRREGPIDRRHHHDHHPHHITTGSSRQNGEHSQDPEDLLQGQQVQQAHPAQGHSVQGRQGLRVRAG